MSEKISIYTVGETPYDLIEGLAKKSGDRLFAITTSITETLSGDDIDVGAIFNIMDLFGIDTSSLSSGPIGQLGQAIGVLESFLKDGKRPPTSLISNNPILSPPNFNNQQFYGELMNYVIAWDQPLKRKVAAFPSPENGSGSMFDMFNTSDIFSGLSNISEIVTNSISLGNIIETNSAMSSYIDDTIDNVTNLLSIDKSYGVELNRADNAIPVAAAISTAISGTDSSPFSMDQFKKGWALYKSVRS